MRSISKKSKVIVAAVAAATLGVSGVAYAYWSTGGSGSGTATTGTTTNNLTISATGWAGLYPGANGAKAFTVTVTNPNPYAVHITSVDIDPTFGTSGNGITTDNAGCLSAWLSTDNTTLAVPVASQNIAAGGNTGPMAFGTLSLSDLLNTDQNACKSPTQVTIHFTSS